MSDPETVRAAVRDYYSAISAGDIDAVLAMFADGAEMRDPVGAPPLSDKDARRQTYERIGAAFDAFAIAPGTIRVGGDEAAATWSVTARAKNGQDVAFDGISTFLFDASGRIARMHAYWEPAALVAAMQA